ncbi:hypothetical protein CINS5918_01465 [Campylobacter insulaenigrae]|uniref:indole-3-glycerol-phosphate synthase n=1 Tax=Campylobacter insulaenigrae TaxID=260714 RepID=A0ABY3G4B3_9BACT|nr:hypothetical protein [Campylobacter insulaenigrae]MCR6581148.1 hypothetical protein [Campylobacter insulaenigrae]TWO24519.1 hypothetical protein ZA01_05275 [Campylobacter insulaenigrae]
MFEQVNLDYFFKKTKKILDQKKEIFSYDMLGRSLSSNAFHPKDLYSLLLENNLSTIYFSKELEIKDNNFDCIILPTSNCQNYDIQNLSLFRRYSQKPIIQFDFIFDEYQILESLVYGSDAFYLFPKMLKTLELKKLYNLAIHLGLEAIFFVENKNDINHSILAGARIFHIEDEKLLNFLPKNKVIISKNLTHLHARIKE